MSSPKYIDKSQDYYYLQPWLGTGLLTSHGKKWHSRRKVKHLFLLILFIVLWYFSRSHKTKREISLYIHFFIFTLQILTPAFHFKILEDFIEVFQEQSSILVSKLAADVNKKSGLNLFKYVTLCTLDIICGKKMSMNVCVSWLKLSQ